MKKNQTKKTATTEKGAVKLSPKSKVSKLSVAAKKAPAKARKFNTLPKANTKTLVVKKAAPKAAGTKSLIKASNEKSFWVSNGMILNDLVALKMALENMDKEAFYSHVENDRNDFADWVDMVLLDAECAKDLRKAKTPKTAQAVVTKHLKLYQL